MSARKKQKLSDSCISDLVIASDSDSDISMSELFESSVESFNDESDDNPIVLPSDWTNTECTCLPFVFQNNSGVQFTVDKNFLMKLFLSTLLMKQIYLQNSFSMKMLRASHSIHMHTNGMIHA